MAEAKVERTGSGKGKAGDREWTRYAEVTLTDEEEAHIEDYGLDGSLCRGRHEIDLLAQSDTACCYGYVSRSGELLLAGAGYLYQHYSETDWHDQIEAAVKRYGGWFVNDSYVQTVVVHMPTGKKARRALTIALERITARCVAQYERKHGIGVA